MVILPGTKNTMADLRWLKETGMAVSIDALRQQGCVIFGVCGGYQMLGRRIDDPDSAEEGGSAEGLGFLEMSTAFSREKRRTRIHGRIGTLPGPLEGLRGMEIEGYEIHMGRTETGMQGQRTEGDFPFCSVTDLRTGVRNDDGAAAGNVYGTYVHGVFDAAGAARRIAEILADRKGVSLKPGSKEVSFPDYKETQYDLLADTLRLHLDLPAIYGILNEEAKHC